MPLRLDQFRSRNFILPSGGVVKYCLVSKYNPENLTLSKGKQRARQTYEKKQFLVTEHREFLTDLIANGGQVELKAEGMMTNGASFMDVRVYYVHPAQQQRNNQTA